MSTCCWSELLLCPKSMPMFLIMCFHWCSGFDVHEHRGFKYEHSEKANQHLVYSITVTYGKSWGNLTLNVLSLSLQSQESCLTAVEYLVCHHHLLPTCKHGSRGCKVLVHLNRILHPSICSAVRRTFIETNYLVSFACC